VRYLLIATLLSATLVATAGCAEGKSAIHEGATTTAEVQRQYLVRGIYDRDSSQTGFDREAGLGFTYIDSNPFDDFDQLAVRGLKGFVWLGGYSNETCSFTESDEWVRKHVSAIAGNPGVGAYFIDDEPDAAKCPRAPADMKARSDLVKSIDPGPPTFLVTYKIDQFRLFAHTVDVLGLDVYPCSIQDGCDYTKIDAQAEVADKLNVRYWGVIQAFGDDWYKLPTADELHREFVHWRATNMEGYLVFAWRHPDGMRSLWLENHPDLQAQLALENNVAPPGA
jgi:hypothetical protein